MAGSGARQALLHLGSRPAGLGKWNHKVLLRISILVQKNFSAKPSVVDTVKYSTTNWNATGTRPAATTELSGHKLSHAKIAILLSATLPLLTKKKNRLAVSPRRHDFEKYGVRYAIIKNSHT